MVLVNMCKGNVGGFWSRHESAAWPSILGCLQHPNRWCGIGSM